jgi:uncharacterized protein YacL
MKNNIWVFVVSGLYLVASLTNPITSSQTLGLSILEVRLLQLTISGLIIFSWIAGTYSYQDLLQYLKHLKDKYQRSAFKKIAQGIMVLVLSSIIPSILNVFGNRLEDTIPWLDPVITIINNYAYVLLPFIAVNLIFIGSKSLARSVNAPQISTTRSVIIMLFPLAFSILNIYLTLTNPTLQGVTHDMRTTYHLPPYLVIITLLAPSIVTWFVGTQALNHVQNYSKNIKGEVYKSAISLLSTGFLFVIVSSIFLQLLLALGEERLMALGVNLIIFVVYLFIILQAVGYVLLARSSRIFAQVDKVLSQYIAR